MASRDSREAHGADKKTDLLLFWPEELKIITDPKHPLYDKRALDPPDEAFINNLEYFKQLQPIVVVKDPETGDTVVAAGRKRTLGMIEVNKRLKKKGLEPRRIEARFRRVGIGDAIAISVSENDQRVAETPSGRRDKAVRMLENGKTEEEVCIALGITTFTLKNMLSIVDAPAFLRNAADSGKITDTNAYKLAKLPPDEAKVKLEELLEKAPRVPGRKRATRASAEAERKILGEKKRGYMTAPSAEAVAAAVAAYGKTNPLPISEPTPPEKVITSAIGKKGKGPLPTPEVFGRRGDNQIENVLAEVLASGASQEAKAAVEAFAKWILGDDKALDLLLPPAQASNGAI